MSTADIAPAPPLDPAQLRPFEDATQLLGDPEALRARAQRDGYLFFRGLLDPEPILALRRAVLGVLDRHGLRADGVDKYSGQLNLDRLYQIPAEQMREDIGVSAQLYFELQQLPELHRLPHHPALLNVYRTLFGADVFVHPRHIMRAMTSHPAMTPTPPHQDFPLVQGSTDTWTCWFPVGDCDVDHGPLAVLRGSHHNGYVPIVWQPGAGGIAAQLCDRENDWVGGGFGIGDVLTFSSLTVHRALRSHVPQEIRISMDVRYQRASDVIEERSLSNHAVHSWDEIYADWTEADRDLMYYWDPSRLSFSPWDDSLIQPGARRIC
jgi:hypothetical protein